MTGSLEVPPAVAFPKVVLWNSGNGKGESECSERLGTEFYPRFALDKQDGGCLNTRPVRHRHAAQILGGAAVSSDRGRGSAWRPVCYAGLDVGDGGS